MRRLNFITFAPNSTRVECHSQITFPTTSKYICELKIIFYRTYTPKYSVINVAKLIMMMAYRKNNWKSGSL